MKQTNTTSNVVQISSRDGWISLDETEKTLSTYWQLPKDNRWLSDPTGSNTPDSIGGINTDISTIGHTLKERAAAYYESIDRDMNDELTERIAYLIETLEFNELLIQHTIEAISEDIL